MDSRHHSASSLKTLSQCEYKYKCAYVDKKPKIENSDEQFLPFGICVHHALEKLYLMHKERFNTEYRFTKEDYDYVYMEFMNKAAETKLNDIKLLEEGWGMLKSRMDGFDYSENVIAVEVGFKLSTEKGTDFLGYIDKAVEIDEDTLLILDYKTSRMAMTQNEADSDIQLSMYDLAASILWPKYKTIVLVLDYLRLKPVMSYRTPEQRKLFIDYLDSTNKYILGKAPEDVKPQLNSLCGWCAFKTMCPAFIKATTEMPESFELVMDVSVDELIEKWERLRNIYKASDGASRALKMHIEKLMRVNGGEDLLGSEHRIALSQNTRVSYDVGALKDFIPAEELLSLCNVSKTAVDKYMSNHSSKLSDAIKSAAQISYTSPSIRIYKNK